MTTPSNGQTNFRRNTEAFITGFKYGVKDFIYTAKLLWQFLRRGGR